MSYDVVATSKTPALIIYLIDNSGSMEEHFAGAAKIDHVNAAIDSILGRMIERSTKGTIIAPRYRLAMAAYSDTVLDMLGDIQTITQVADMGSPELAPTNSTDTYAAFAWARDLLRRELPNLRGTPAPMVCHLTDGQFTGKDPEPIAQEIMQMSNDDGNVLVENICIGSDLTTTPISDVERWPGIRDISEVKDSYAQKLYRMSSSMPDGYAAMIAQEGYGMKAGSKLLLPGGNRALIELAFAVSGATPTFERKA